VGYTGAIESWALSLELFNSIREMRDVSFVFSGWSYDGFAQEAIKLCQDVPHIHFDLGLKSRSELNYLVSNSDMGLVFYDSADPNVAAIGLSSGKLHKFLSYGKPVVVNDVSSIRVFLEDNGFGLARRSESIPEAITEILGNYEDYSQRVKGRYPSLVDFRSSYEQFIAATGRQ
jgi:glycosyltransferase involved in cell wall biosynthesis